MTDTRTNDIDPARPLAGQRALVTGASSGIGRGVAIALAQAGADVALNYVGEPEGAIDGRDRAREAGVKAVAVEGDVSSDKDVAAVFATVVDAFGGLDILVANAGIQQDASIKDMTREKWDRVLGVNLTGQFLCAQAAVAQFRRQGRTQCSRALGKIVCMSSVHQEIPWAGHVNYAASKGGIMMMMRTMAQELAPDGIRVNAVAPGAIATHINEAAWNTEKARTQLETLIPYGRVGNPDDVARAIVWLASDLSDYVVGTTLFVDGGMSLYPGFLHGG